MADMNYAVRLLMEGITEGQSSLRKMQDSIDALSKDVTVSVKVAGMSDVEAMAAKTEAAYAKLPETVGVSMKEVAREVQANLSNTARATRQSEAEITREIEANIKLRSKLAQDEYRAGAKFGDVMRGRYVGVTTPEDTATSDMARINALRQNITQRLDPNIKLRSKLAQDEYRAGAKFGDVMRGRYVGVTTPEDTATSDMARINALRQNITQRLDPHEAYVHSVASRYRQLGIKEEEALALARIKATREATSAREQAAKPGWLEGFGTGEGLRRVVAKGLHSVIGEGALASAVSGTVGILAGSVLLRMGWLLGDAILSAPGKIAKEREEYQFLGGGVGGNARQWWYEAEASLFAKMAGSAAGPGAGRAGLGSYQAYGLSPQLAAESMKALSTIAAAEQTDPAKLAATWAHMQATPTPESRVEALRSSLLVRQALHESFPQIARGPMWEKRLEVALGQAGTLGSRDLMQAAIDAAESKFAAGRERAVNESIGGNVRGLSETVWRAASGITPPRRVRQASELSPAPTRDDLAKAGIPSGEQDRMAKQWTETDRKSKERTPHPEPGFSDISFTSIAGLAEQMQMMRIGPQGDYAQTTANATSRLLDLAIGGGVKVVPVTTNQNGPQQPAEVP